jgi:hypothetical protein
MCIRHFSSTALFIAAFALQAEVAPLAVSADFAFSVDTCAKTVLVKSLDAVALPYRIAQRVTAAGEDAAGASTLVESAEGTGEYLWTPTAGGVWMLENSVEGSATFLVRHSLFPESQGAGTESDPAKIVDDDEIPEMIAAGQVSSGYVFSLCGAASPETLDLPSGWALQGVADGIYMLVAASGEKLYESAGVPFMVDSRRPGPDRRWRTGVDAAISYSGDNWIGDAAKRSVLTIVAPSGATEETILPGTGLYGFRPLESGVYRLMLSTDSTNMASRVSTATGGFTVRCR